MKHLNNVITTLTHYPANIYLFKVNNINTRKRSEIYPKLTSYGLVD